MEWTNQMDFIFSKAQKAFHTPNFFIESYTSIQVDKCFPLWMFILWQNVVSTSNHTEQTFCFWLLSQ